MGSFEILLQTDYNQLEEEMLQELNPNVRNDHSHPTQQSNICIRDRSSCKLVKNLFYLL